VYFSCLRYRAEAHVDELDGRLLPVAPGGALHAGDAPGAAAAQRAPSKVFILHLTCVSYRI
jgi:hypothetical protein